MTPARLRTLLAVVDSGSAKAAAANLSVTESAVSASLAALQREVGAPLFERSGRVLRLTEAGRIFVDYARKIVGLMEESVAATRAGPVPTHGRLRLGAVTVADEFVVPRLLAGFRSRYPGVSVSVDVIERNRLLVVLADHQLDVVIGPSPHARSDLVSHATRPNELIVVAREHVDDFAAATWLLRETGSGTRVTTLALLESLDIAPPLLAVGSHGAAIECAVAGLGLAVVPATTAARYLEAGTLVRIDVPGTPVNRPWHLVTGQFTTNTTRLFVAHVLDPARAGDLVFTAR